MHADPVIGVDEILDRLSDPSTQDVVLRAVRPPFPRQELPSRGIRAPVSMWGVKSPIRFGKGRPSWEACPMEDPAPQATTPAPTMGGAEIASAVVCVVAAILPVFLTGALAVQLKSDLRFDDAALGLAVAAYFASAAMTSTLLGRAVERIGAGRALRWTSALAAVVAIGLASARSWGALAAWLAAGGVVNAGAQPAANLLLARTVPASRQGLAFGIKQAAMPLATLLGGVAVPALALTVGWRWAYVGGAALALVAVAVAPGNGSATARRTRGGPSRPNAPLGPLTVLGVGVGFGAAAAGALATFLVSAGVDAGLGADEAGWLLTFGSLAGVVARLWVGARADRRGGGHLRVVAVMLGGGAVAFVLFSLGGPSTYLVVTPLAFGMGWAWPGLFNFAVVRNNADAPSHATGITQTGTYLGALAGPLAFGWVAETWSYPEAWLLGATWYLLGAAAVIAGRRSMLHLKEMRGIPANQPLR